MAEEQTKEYYNNRDDALRARQKRDMKNIPKEIYNCGHIKKEVIINTNTYTLSKYLEWKDSGTENCLECWIKDKV